MPLPVFASTLLSVARAVRELLFGARGWMTAGGPVLASVLVVCAPVAAQSADSAVTALESYEILVDGQIVRDPKTGLEWMRCSLGQRWNGNTCAGEVSKHSFDDAPKQAQSFNQRGGLGGKTDWRVPTLRELAGLIYCSSDKIWLSSPFAGEAEGAWTIHSGYGTFDPYRRDKDSAVRLVRASPSSDGEAALGSGAAVTPEAPSGMSPTPGGPEATTPAQSVSQGHEAKKVPSTPPSAEDSAPATRQKAATTVEEDDAASGKEGASAPSACARLSNGTSVRVRVSGYPQLQPAMVLSVDGSNAEVRVMTGAAAGRKLRVACSAVRR